MFYQIITKIYGKRCCTLAVVIGIFLLIVIRAQDFFFLLRQGRICLACLRATSTTVRLWPVWGGQIQREKGGKKERKLKGK